MLNFDKLVTETAKAFRERGATATPAGLLPNKQSLKVSLDSKEIATITFRRQFEGCIVGYYEIKNDICEVANFITSSDDTKRLARYITNSTLNQNW